MSSNNPLTIPLIPYGLRQEETIVQIASALDSIDCLVNDVFQQIENSIIKHKKYLSDLQRRSEIVARKVDKLAGKNVATTVYSDHKFPTRSVSSDSLFSISLRPIEKKPDVFIESKFQHIKYNKSLSKLHFFHIKSEVRSCEEELILEKGLGCIPSDVNCVTSLLLFNTAENLYQKYVFLDPLAISNEVKLMQEEKRKSDIAAAPTSILTDQIFENRDYDGSFYLPPFVEVPSFNVPLDLPDLPGIAGDVKYNYGDELSIAPSKQPEECEKPKTIEDISATDLPVITEPRKTKTPSNVTEASASFIPRSDSSPQTVQPSPSQPISSSESIPPPPPFPSTELTIPPPPPPMPNLNVPLKSETTAVNTEKSQTTPKLPAPTENMHGALMEAIRKAGGKEKAMLRPVENRANNNVKPGNLNANNQFLDQLYNVLALRRKGISGRSKEDKNIAIMSRVSELIIPSSESENESSEDSEVTNDWDE